MQCWFYDFIHVVLSHHFTWPRWGLALRKNINAFGLILIQLNIILLKVAIVSVMEGLGNLKTFVIHKFWLADPWQSDHISFFFYIYAKRDYHIANMPISANCPKSVWRKWNTSKLTRLSRTCVYNSDFLDRETFITGICCSWVETINTKSLRSTPKSCRPAIIIRFIKKDGSFPVMLQDVPRLEVSILLSIPLYRKRIKRHKKNVAGVLKKAWTANRFAYLSSLPPRFLCIFLYLYVLVLYVQIVLFFFSRKDRVYQPYPFPFVLNFKTFTETSLWFFHGVCVLNVLVIVSLNVKHFAKLHKLLGWSVKTIICYKSM